jgi:hypothetical protein
VGEQATQRNDPPEALFSSWLTHLDLAELEFIAASASRLEQRRKIRLFEIRIKVGEASRTL